MITVVEVWHLRPELGGDALALMQEMDDLLGGNAHEHPGWCGHARFFQSAGDPSTVMMLYPWRSRELHEDLLASEEQLLAPFYERCCTARREVHYYEELAVEVEHDHA
ncbi:MAG TPA: hypothetical protein VGB14_08690 [Acidimicrobiales bacterium]|jgi:3-oxoacyl-[acyl-carrier protein] reductase